MKRFFSFFLFSLLLSSSLSDSSSHDSPNPTTSGAIVVMKEGDFQALVAFKHALVDPLMVLRSWNESDQSSACASWLGIKCALGGQIVALQLPNKGLGGRLAPEIGQLTTLRKLNLHTNAISGAIPPSLSFLRNLRGLYLFQNRFSGAIPASLASSLPFLQALDLSRNQFSGEIPLDLANCTQLWRLDFSYNNLSGAIPPSLGDLPAIRDLRLASNGLTGPFPPRFGNLRHLQTLDLSGNHLNGSIPKEISGLSSLLFLNLSRNVISGAIPVEVGGLSRLISIDLRSNVLLGEIPPQLGNITGMATLDISKNNLSGPIPDPIASLKNLTSFDCSDNNLTGPVPLGLSKRFASSAFLGNPGLCNFSPSSPCPSLSTTPSSSPSPSQSGTLPANRKGKLSKLSFIFIIVGSIVAGALLICLVGVVLWRCLCHKRGATGSAKGEGKPRGGAGGGHESGKEGTAGGGPVGGGRLVHFEGSTGFTADDLLCATAEVLGKSTYGTVYKATLEDGRQLAVKRLREGIVRGQREFEAEVGILGSVRHPYLVPLRAYYWGAKDEKLLIHDFMPRGSLAAYLHARGPDMPMDWQVRLRIASNVAQGLAHLHQTHKMTHGNLTSSNILLTDEMSAKLSDFGLSRLMTAAANSTVMATAGALGYRAPELTKARKASPKSDVYSLGVVLLELLTGRAPGEAATAEMGMDLPEWVASTVKEEWTNEIFDVEIMKGNGAGEDDLINTLQLAMNCVSLSPGSRPEMEEVVRLLQEVENNNPTTSETRRSPPPLASPSVH